MSISSKLEHMFIVASGGKDNDNIKWHMQVRNKVAMTEEVTIIAL